MAFLGIDQGLKRKKKVVGGHVKTLSLAPCSEARKHQHQPSPEEDSGRDLLMSIQAREKTNIRREGGEENCPARRGTQGN